MHAGRRMEVKQGGRERVERLSMRRRRKGDQWINGGGLGNVTNLSKMCKQKQEI